MDSSSNSSEELRCNNNNNIMEEYLKEDIDEIELPGFRFHPTDEELVSFYLRRKLDNKPISIELIKQIDIYKYDPWDLPKGSGSTGGGEKEGYFYCKRGRKYRNSIRPNRVTGSGFWKATGIDKPVYNSLDHSNNNNNIIIGLKKTLVYYRGSAGKGTKTQWMMHEFRIPPAPKNHILTNHDNILQEAEIWTLCRIFKRNTSNRKCAPEWRHLGGGGGKRHSSDDHEKKSTSTTSVTMESSAITTDSDHHYPPQAYINFGDTHHTFFQDHKPVINNSNYYYNQVCVNTNNQYLCPNSLLPQPPHQLLNASSVVPSSSSSSSSPLSFWINHPTTTAATTTNDDMFAFDKSSWDELGSVVQFPL